MLNLRKTYFWNILASVTYSLMSFLMMLVTVRLLGAEAGGIYSIAFSSSLMLQSLGTFGMRTYQATDVTDQFNSGEYVSSRIITAFAMAIACYIYGWFMHYEAEKRIVYLLFCGIRLFEAFADVMEGILHQKNRLDIASQSAFLRAVFIMAGFIGALLAGCSLVTASFLAFLLMVLSFFICTCPLTYKFERIFISMNYRRVLELLLRCLPLFLVQAASAYVGYAPKAAIELNLDDLAQTQFAVIFTPVAVIQLLGSFIFQPYLNTFARYFAAKEKERIHKLICIFTFMIAGLTFIAFVGTYILGVPVLGWVYQVDISEQKNALLLAVLSGGVYTIVVMLSQVLTAMRRQNNIFAGYLIANVVIAMISNPLVKYFGILGSVLLYFLSMILLTTFFVYFYLYYLKKLERD